MVDGAYPGGTDARSGAQGIRELIERTFLMGVGAAAFTVERVQELVGEFVKRGELSSDEGREMVDKLVARSRDEARSAMKKADSSLQGVLRDFGITTKRELEDLEMRIRQLEHRVALLENASDETAPSPGHEGDGVTG